MDVAGMPLHPLVVHAAVVFTPLAALLALAFLVPAWRLPLRWPLALTAALAVVSVLLAVSSGESLLHAQGAPSPVLELHEERAEQLRVSVLAMSAAILGASWVLPARAGQAGRLGRLPALVVGGFLALTAVATLVLVVLTGDAGARSVWG